MTVLSGLVAEAWSTIEPNLAGLTDEAYTWEPTPGCWSIRLRSELEGVDHWGKGDWVVETSFDGSVEPTGATIAWRLMHAYDCFADYSSKAFGHGARDWNDIEVPSDASTAVKMMTEAVQSLRYDLDHQNDAVLIAASDDAWEHPRWLLLDKALLEWIHHCAEVGVLRQLHSHLR